MMKQLMVHIKITIYNERISEYTKKLLKYFYIRTIRYKHNVLNNFQTNFIQAIVKIITSSSTNIIYNIMLI